VTARKKKNGSAGGELEALLRARGLRRTKPRLAVLRFVKSHARPLTHGEIAEALEPQGLDRATVYRNLIDLAEVGLLARRDLGDHVWRFELQRPEGDAGHAHFICTACGAITCLPDDAIRIVAPRRAPKALRDGGRALVVEIKGTCDACA
jgi:Fur family ferric uptake transcriptional regulator